MSLGGEDPSDGTDPMSQALDQISAQTGTLFVVAAGNSGAEATGTGKWLALYTAPSHGYVSIKVTTKDTAGNNVSQEVTRAYHLK